VVKVVRSSLDGQVNVFETEIRLHVALKETAKAGRSILEYDSSSPSAEAYRNLASEVLAVCGDTGLPRERMAAPNVLEFPVHVVTAPEPAEEILPLRQVRSEVPSFSSFLQLHIVEGSCRWLGASH